MERPSPFLRMWLQNPLDFQVKTKIIENGNVTDLLYMYKQNPLDFQVKNALLNVADSLTLLGLLNQNPLDFQVRQKFLEIADAEHLEIMLSKNPLDMEMRNALLNYKGKDDKKLIIREHEKEHKNEVFICHVSEDKESFVDSLVAELKKAKIKTWYDSDNLEWGDSLKERIENGINESKYAIVVISPSFIKKNKWARKELEALFTIETNNGKKKILPILHNVSNAEFIAFSPLIASKKYLTSKSISEIVLELRKVLAE